MGPDQESTPKLPPKYVTRNQFFASLTVVWALSVLAAWGLSRLDLYRIERQLDRIETAVEGRVMTQIGVQSVNADKEFNEMTRDVLRKAGSVQ